MVSTLLTTRTEFSDQFFQKLLELISGELGEDFLIGYTKLKNRREQFLQEQWVLYEASEDDAVFREVDYEYLITTLRRFVITQSRDVLELQLQIAELCIQFGEIERAYDLLIQLMPVLEDLGNQPLGKVYLLLGRIESLRNRYQASRQYLNRAHEYYARRGDSAGMVAASLNLGVLSSMRWDTASGFRYFKDAEEMLNGDISGTLGLKLLTNQAIIQGMRGEFEDAARLFEDLMSHPAAQDPVKRIHLLINRGLAKLGTGELLVARDSFREAVDLAGSLPEANLFGLGAMCLSEVLVLLGEFDEGHTLLVTAFKIITKLGDRYRLAEAYRVFGLLHREMGLLDLAAANFEVSIEINAEAGNLLNLCETYYEYSVLADIKDDLITRKQYLQRSLSYAEAMRAVPRINRLQKEIDTLT